MPQPASFDQERKLHTQGYHFIAGIDEVGRGAIAGPVAAAAVILPYQLDAPWLSLVCDSKQLSPKKREHFSWLIQKAGLAIGVGMVSQTEIDDNIPILAFQFVHNPFQRMSITVPAECDFIGAICSNDQDRFPNNPSREMKQQADRRVVSPLEIIY